MKEQEKIGKLILNYFNFVNPLPCDEVKIEFCEFFDLYTINIKSENYLDYTRHKRGIQANSKTVCDEIRYSMENLFPYKFRVVCVVDRDFYKKI